MEQATPWLDSIIRWLHVLAGITWIGHLYFFNWVNAQVAKTYDADSKKKVVPELMPRALYFFRWGAMWTWVTGVLLLGLVFYMTSVGPRNAETAPAAVAAVGLGGMILAFFVYDFLWKSPLAKNEYAGAAVSLVLLAGLAYAYQMFMSPRGVWIHVGATLGTTMFLNVWMRIWPAQKKIINGIKGAAPAPDAAVPALAGLRSKHNTYLSIGLLAMMLNTHIVGSLADRLQPAFLSSVVVVVIGFGIAKLLFVKSASPAPVQI